MASPFRHAAPMTNPTTKHATKHAADARVLLDVALKVAPVLQVARGLGEARGGRALGIAS
jgi:hypothetical protein